MAEQGQQNRIHHYRVKQLRFVQLLRLIVDMQRESSPKGMIIMGVSGIGKTIGVETYQQVEKI